MIYLVGDTDNEGDYALWGTRDVWEISALSSQYCYEHKAALKNKLSGKKSGLGTWFLSISRKRRY